MVQLFSPHAGKRLHRPDTSSSAYRMAVRLAIGLLQGIALYALVELTPDREDLTGFYAAWALAAAYAPPVALAAIGQISKRAALAWASLVTILLGAIGLSSGVLPSGYEPFATMAICLPAALFCAHHLVIPAIKSGQAFTSYEQYFETAWKAGIQLVLALMFLGVFWLILLLGAGLFSAIGIRFVQQLIEEPAFYIIASAVLFALGVELSDVRDGLTQGIRTVALTLLSWLLPVAVFLAAAFVIALPLRGLSALNTSLSPAGLMLSATAGLIVLINTTYQDGREHLSENRFLRGAVRIGSVLLLPMTAFALWGVWVRISQYGLTVPRIIAITAAVIGLIYGVGYLLGQFRGRSHSEGWLPLLEATNIVAAIATTLVLVGYSTPWLNPQQLAMNSQFARLDRGNLTADEIPFGWLAWKAGPKGREYLVQLSQSEDDEIARTAQLHLNNNLPTDAQQDTFKLTFLPDGTPAPEGFEAMLRERPVSGQCKQVNGCLARLYDTDADGTDEVLLSAFNAIFVYQRDTQGQWAETGTFSLPPDCSGDLPRELLNHNAPVATRKSGPQPIELGGHVLDFVPSKSCEP